MATLVDTEANLLAASRDAFNALPEAFKPFAPDVEQRIGPYITKALPFTPSDISQFVANADVFMRDPATSIQQVAVGYIQNIVADAIAGLVTQALGAALGTALCPGLGTVAGQAIGKALGDIVNDLTSKRVDPYVERDGSWIPEVEDVLDRWIQPFGDPKATSKREIRNANDAQNHNPRRWPAGTPYRKVIGDILHDMSRWHHSDALNWYEVGTGGDLGTAANFQDDDHYHWGQDWWVNPLQQDPPTIKEWTWFGRFKQDLDDAVQRSAVRRSNEATARANMVHLTLVAYQHQKSLLGAFNVPKRRTPGSASAPPPVLSPVILAGITAAAKANAIAAAHPVVVSTLGTPARLPDWVSFYLGGGTAGLVPPPRPV